MSEVDYLDTNNIYLFMDGFENKSVKPVIEWILRKNLAPAKDRAKHLTLVINSPGGDLSAAFALIDIVQGSRIPVHTLGLGQISSAGLLIFMSGRKNHRTITPNTSILSHQYSWGSEGKEHELLAIIKEFNLTARRMLNHYKHCTGMSEKKIKEVLMPPQDVYLDAEEAVKYQIADRVVDTYLGLDR